ncbi:MAG: UDP-N-acetylglucosamine 2-epimerase (non-hydrolyzing) [Acidimicrobiales bacterium]|nr:UDP-N-acetylglucosamine 2-epimerase (non-hydrolyzing) [Acidimicrobiales bacterium]HRW36481.1 UDP-N-acetylglucosamine 2-epimerase (non-hydrolyzing) [Aquihabitans sp.]
MHLVTVIGARPQFVKASAFAAAVRAEDDDRPFRHDLVHTGQHYDDAMSGVFFRELGIDAPAIDLGVGSGGHGEQTGEMLKRLEPVLIDRAPDALLVYGDTNSTLAAALAAAKLDVPIAHVEAGLRSHRRAMPEEINRVVTDRLSTLLFCPSEAAAENCAREGITEGVEVIGDVMRDALDLQLRSLPTGVHEELGVQPGAYALATLHRAENTDDPVRLAAALDGLVRVAAAGLPVLLPAHPRTRALADLDELSRRGVLVVGPQSFARMVALEAEARVILTDSGGVQKEALWLGVPCVTLRDETEWIETVESGWNQLVGADAQAIEAAALAERPAGDPPPLYGDGGASARVLRSLRRTFER